MPEIDRPLVERKLQVHFDYSRENASFTGKPQSKATNLHVDKIVDTNTGEVITIPSHSEIVNIAESTGLDVESVQSVSGQALTLGGERPVVELGFIVTFDEDEIDLDNINSMENAFADMGVPFEWSRVVSEVDGSVVGGPRPFASTNIDIIITWSGSILTDMEIAEIEADVAEETREGVTNLEPDIASGGTGMMTVKTRENELFRESFDILQENTLLQIEMGMGMINQTTFVIE